MQRRSTCLYTKQPPNNRSVNVRQHFTVETGLSLLAATDASLMQNRILRLWTVLQWIEWENNMSRWYQPSDPVSDSYTNNIIQRFNCNILSFLQGVSIACYAEPSISYGRDVCLSVHLSVTCWHWVKTTQARIMKSSPTDSPVCQRL